MAFANGKLLLLGEHSVVHGEPAIAAALDLGVAASAVAAPARLRCEAWGLDAAPGDGTRVGEAFAALLSALPDPIRPAAVVLDPSVPAGAGLGSSAAMAVATARALAELAGVALSDEQLEAAALASEKVFHGNPSGLDHAVAIHGGLLRYVRTPSGRRFSPLPCARRLDLVVAQVEPGADTGRMVAAVGAQRARLGAIGVALHRLVGEVVRRAEAAIGAGELELLGELMSVDHHLLGAMGVSTPALDAACHAARAAGALGAKLTGSGGGGCVIALVGDRGAAAVENALAPLALGVYRASVGPSGRDPATEDT